MIYGHTSELAIRATLYLALQPLGKLSPIREIAQGTGLPGPYLAKIMRQLIRVGLVRAFRGPGGGLELGRAPEQITLWSVVQALDGEAQPTSCVLGLRACCAENPCPLHQRWVPLRQQIKQLLEETTLTVLVGGLSDTTPLRLDSWVELRRPAARRSSSNREKQRSA